MVDDRRALRDAILDKATRYGDVKDPYVVAVNAVSQDLDDIAIGEALFGKETFIFPIRGDGMLHDEADDQPRLRRLPDGAWTSSSGPRNTRVSAVLIVSHLMPWTIATAQPRLYHNPRARRPYTGELTRLPQAVPHAGRMEKRDGVSAANLFGLSQGWPRSTAA